MRNFVKLLLLSLIIVICFFFFKKYFSEKIINDSAKKEKITTKNRTQENQNNLIENLSYSINFDNGGYTISSDLSEIYYVDDDEIVDMEIVKAVLIGEDKTPITIRSDEASYNNSNFDTKFEKNIVIKYLDHIIKAESAHIDFKANKIWINDNVRYHNSNIKMKSDNITIDMISKKINIFMDKKTQVVNLSFKQN